MDGPEIRWEYYPLVAAHPASHAFVERLSLKGKRPKTIAAYARAIEDLLNFFARQDPSLVLEADEADLDTYIAHLKQRGPKKRGQGGIDNESNIRYLTGRKLSDNTIVLHIVACRLFYDFLIRKRLRSDPINPIERGSNGRDGHRPTRGPFKRREELILLRVDDIDWARGFITIRPETTKSGRTRYVPVSAGVLHLVRHYIEGDRRALIAAYDGDDAGQIFLSESTRNPGCPLAVGAFDEIMERVRARVGLNASLIPLLCAKAGVDRHDARGNITGHRGRSTRLTLLRSNGMSLEDLAEYAGHSDTKTIRRYVRDNPIQLHRRIRKADDMSRIIEGVVDLQAAAAGQPALRWFIGYDTDGEPMFCGNQSYATCPHRLDCERCGMFIGGEKARLLQQGANTLPVTSQVPMTPLETCVTNGDEVGAEACQAALKQIPAPETPDIRLIFNLEGLSNHELEKLAEMRTAESLEKLHQALEAHEKELTDMLQQHKTGRNALVTAQKKRIMFIQDLMARGAQRRHEQTGG